MSSVTCVTEWMNK